ncbi:G protein pathway suppressor 2-like isoform X2 [Hyalella azteca]|uniref:G protein pathway suppressor 2-like isoform X2 n=1 Tax=Hyalella azteca TaxID=294128 RepID=A0A8B7PDC8_HYAAZ|nr:G protein pathway suppressor 2-like isoform X2 [Hyalella azteca]
MVKFAEAEKRGRGGDTCTNSGSSGSNTMSGSGTNRPYMMIDKPKINRPMLDALKAHIMQERRRKHEEQQEVEAEERRRKEHESRKKQHAMTLEETKESIAKQTQQLEVLKNKKHDLFQQLKKVLNNEDKRKERHDQHPTYMKENDIIVAQQQPQMPLPLHSQQVVFQSGLLHGGVPRSSISSLYKLSSQSPHPLQPSQQQPSAQQSQINIKRSRSPSPVSYQNAALPYSFKNLSANSTTVVSVSQPGARSVYLSSPASAFFHGPPGQPPPSHHSQPPHHHPPPPSAAHHPQPPASHHQPQALHHPASQASHHHPPPGQYSLARDEKHTAVYGLHAAAAAAARASLMLSGAGLHPMDHKKPGEPEKLYSGPHGMHALPLQQSNAVKSGSITSGFPVRQTLPPPATQAPPASHSNVPQAYGHQRTTYY